MTEEQIHPGATVYQCPACGVVIQQIGDGDAPLCQLILGACERNDEPMELVDPVAV